MKKIYISLFIILCITLLVIIYNVSKKIDEKNHLAVYDNINKVLNFHIYEEEKLALSIALSSSKNDAVKEALVNEDEDKAYAILQDSISYLTQFIESKNLYSQILTKDLFVLARSWDQLYSGMPLEYFREDLYEVITTYKPKVEIEVGRLLSIKATSPIIHEEDVLGMFEIVVLLDTIVEQMRRLNIELLPIMNTVYLDKAYLMELNEVVQKEYVLVNKNYNIKSLEILNKLSSNEFNELKNDNFLIKDGYYISSYPMKNSKNKELGKFVVMIDYADINELWNLQNSFIKNIIDMSSTKEDIYNYVKYKDKNLFMNIDKGYIANIKDLVEQNDLVEFEEVAFHKLSNLSKEELINFILQKPKLKNIRGDIK